MDLRELTAVEDKTQDEMKIVVLNDSCHILHRQHLECDADLLIYNDIISYSSISIVRKV